MPIDDVPPSCLCGRFVSIAGHCRNVTNDLIQEVTMRGSILAGMFMIASLLGASACLGEVDEIDGQSSEALVGVGEDLSGDEANPSDDSNATAPDPGRDAIGQCPPGGMCMWDYDYYQGQFWWTQQGGCQTIPPVMNNKCSSWYNRSNRWYHMYTGPGCTGLEVTVAPGAANPNVMPPMDNAVSSVCTGPTCP